MREMKLISLETREARAADTLDYEVRFSDVGEDGTLEGVAVVWNVTDSYRTQFAPEAFKSHAGRRVPILWNHNRSDVLGSWSLFQVRDDGLAVKGKLNLDVAKAREIHSMLRANDISGLSVGFQPVKASRAGKGVIRFTEVQLTEISITAFPAVPGSGITKVRFSEDTGQAGALAFVSACKRAAKAF
jgi:uncharacterized protein